MSDLPFGVVDLLIATAFIGVVLAATVWMRIKPDHDQQRQRGDARDQPSAPVFTQAIDWILAAFNLTIGLLLGVALDGLIRLMVSGAWAAVVTLVVLAVVLSLIVKLHDRLGEMLFLSGIRPARNAGKKKPLPKIRRFSLPVGLVVGVSLAQFGLTNWLSGWLL